MSTVAGSDALEPAGEHGVWGRVAPFIALTFGLSWLIDLGICLHGVGDTAFAIVALQLQILVPAASAILLGLFSARYGAVRVRESTRQARWFFYFFLALASLYVAITVAALVVPGLAASLAGDGWILGLLSAVVLLVLRLAKGRESFARAGLTFGKPIHWLVYGLALVAFSAAMTALNWAFRLGSSGDLTPWLGANPMSVEVSLIALVVQTVILSPFLGLVTTFGEEFGWRGFLQGELVQMGRVRGVVAVGAIWGLWHAPIIAMGRNYPGYPFAGIFLMTAYCLGFGFVLSYAMLKTRSIWLVAFLHALANQTTGVLAVAYVPRDPVFQFGYGLFMLAPLAIVVAMLLRDPTWEGKGIPSSEPAAEPAEARSAVAGER